jgi:predicted aspartyl protease
VSVSGAPPRPFILDTGSSYTVVDLQVAKSLELPLYRMGKIQGGSGDEPPDYYVIPDKVAFGLPGVVFSTQDAVAMSFARLQDCFANVSDANGLKKGSSQRVLGGILGKDFFDSHVVAVDYAARLVDLYEPRSYRYAGMGKSLTLEIGGYIYTNARIAAPRRNSIKARLMIDTGASAPLTLTQEFVKANGLPAGKALEELNDCGIGGVGESKLSVGTLRAIQLGGIQLSNPVTVFLKNPEALDYDGVLGGLALRGFKVIFDYSRDRMILEPQQRSRRR